MRFLVRLASEALSGKPLLTSVRSLARSAGGEARAPKWTSYGALEVDIFCPTTADFDLFLALLRPIVKIEFSRDLNVAPPYKSEPELFEEARLYFNSERYWESHEVIEGVWRQKSGPEKRFLQAVILVCAAFVHHQKGEEDVAIGVLRRADAQLDYPGREYGGISVPHIKENVRKILASRRFEVFRI